MSSEQSGDQQEIERLERELVAAFLAGDLGAMDRILADDFVFTDPQGIVLTKAAWAADVESGELSFERADLDELRVYVSGESGVAYGLVTLKARSPQGGYHGQYSYIDVYMKRGGRWRAVLSTGERVRVMARRGNDGSRD